MVHFGAVGGDRTHDLVLTKDVPYHLATTAYLVILVGIEPTTPSKSEKRSTTELKNRVGGNGGGRTRDTSIMSAVLYQLSYVTVLLGGGTESRTQIFSMPC